MKPIMNFGLFWQAILSEQRKVSFFLPAGGTVQRAA